MVDRSEKKQNKLEKLQRPRVANRSKFGKNQKVSNWNWEGKWWREKGCSEREDRGFDDYRKCQCRQSQGGKEAMDDGREILCSVMIIYWNLRIMQINYYFGSPAIWMVTMLAIASDLLNLLSCSVKFGHCPPPPPTIGVFGSAFTRAGLLSCRSGLRSSLLRTSALASPTGRRLLLGHASGSLRSATTASRFRLWRLGFLKY